MFAKSLRCVLGLAVVLMAGAALADEDILIDNFERWGDDAGWTIKGGAFLDEPSKEGGTGVTGHQREKFIYSASNGGDDSKGTLTSPLLEIERDHINFLIGGGGFEGETCMNLIVDGKIVRTATGPNTKEGGTKALEWHSWDVGKWKGKKARIQIVDDREGLWGYIAVDFIYQSDHKMESINNVTREFSLEKKYLNFPTNIDSPQRLVHLLIDGKIVREFLINLAEGEPQLWIYLEIDDFKGEKATLHIAQLNSNNTGGFDSVFQADTFPGEDKLYKEKLRPQFHFSSKRGWINDPNGLVYYKGEYHLFYQHNQFGVEIFNMTWGHAVSTDLIHWTELGDALQLDELGPKFSGSGVVDWNNTTGFQTGDEPPLVFLYTSAGGWTPWSEGRLFTQCMAYSNDRGRTLTKYKNNPVQGHIISENRDPKAIWWEETKEWVIVLELDDTFGFFTSKDLKQWKMQSILEAGAFHDCPELFELPVDGDKNNTKWVIHDGTGKYFYGNFDGKKYTPESEIIKGNHGDAFYASQSFSNVPNRHIEIAWGLIPAWGTPPLEGMPFNQQMLFPVELTLHTTEEGIRMFTNPVREIESIHGKEHAWTDEQLQPGQNILSNLKGELFDINAEFVVGDATEFGFVIRGIPVVYNAKTNTLSCSGQEAPLKSQNGRIRLRILVDRTSVEIYANDGRIYMPICALHMDDKRGLEVFTKGDATRITSLKVHELRSIWN